MSNTDFVLRDMGRGMVSLESYRGSDKVVTVPNGIRRIDSGAFAGLEHIDRVIIPPSVVQIQPCAFENSSIKSIVLPGSLETVYDLAFAGCKQLTRIEIRNPRINLKKTPFANIAEEYEIIFSGSKAMFEKVADTCVGKEVHSSGDYHHPTATHFECWTVESRLSIFARDDGSDFTCRVTCTDGELVYHAEPYEIREVRV